jgi:hypothetical protein
LSGGRQSQKKSNLQSVHGCRLYRSARMKSKLCDKLCARVDSRSLGIRDAVNDRIGIEPASWTGRDGDFTGAPSIDSTKLDISVAPRHRKGGHA